MSSKLPVISGDDLVRVLEKLGYAVVRQKGSHVRLRHSTDPQRKSLTVPRHKTLKRGLLHRLLRDARITEEQLSDIL
jgi:predicted RNA binding protein YcfA (HicA-like mRNA interferase family)